MLTATSYAFKIARPIALDMIKRKINQGAYATLESFEDDFELMFENAKQYNAEGSDVYLDAEDLQVRNTAGVFDVILSIDLSTNWLLLCLPLRNCSGKRLERIVEDPPRTSTQESM